MQLYFKPSEIRIAFEAIRQRIPNIRDKQIQLVITPWGIPTAFIPFDWRYYFIEAVMGVLIASCGIASLLNGNLLSLLILPILLPLFFAPFPLPLDLPKRPTVVMPVFNLAMVPLGYNVWEVMVHELFHISSHACGLCGIFGSINEESRAVVAQRIYHECDKGYPKLRYLFESKGDS